MCYMDHEAEEKAMACASGSYEVGLSMGIHDWDGVSAGGVDWGQENFERYRGHRIAWPSRAIGAGLHVAPWRDILSLRPVLVVGTEDLKEFSALSVNCAPKDFTKLWGRNVG